MDKLSNLLPRQITSNQSLELCSKRQELNEISVYTDPVATVDEVTGQLKILSMSFPDIDNDFLAVLTLRLIANGFTKDRLNDAIGAVIDACHYKRPSIAEIVSFDRKMKLYTYNEMAAKCTQQYTSENFERIEINGQIRFFEK